MRLWSWQLLSSLPDMQFRGQWRELVAVMRDWRDKKTTNHLLINRVMEYPKQDLGGYYLIYREEYQKRYGKERKTKKGLKSSLARGASRMFQLMARNTI